MGEKNTQTKSPRNIWDNPAEILLLYFVCQNFFAPKTIWGAISNWAAKLALLGVVLPTFPWSRNSRFLVLHDLIQTDEN